MEKMQLEKNLWDANEKELLEMARKAETLEKQKTAELVALKQKKAVAKESLLRKNAQQKHRQELSKYICPHNSGIILLTLSLKTIRYSPILQKSMN